MEKEEEVDPIDKFISELGPKPEEEKKDKVNIEFCNMKEKYGDIMDSEGELDTDKFRKFKKRKMNALREVDHNAKTYERVKTVKT